MVPGGDVCYLDLWCGVELDAAAEGNKIASRYHWSNAEEKETEELSQGGFNVESLWGDLTGVPCSADSEWIGVIAQKR